MVLVGIVWPEVVSLKRSCDAAGAVGLPNGPAKKRTKDANPICTIPAAETLRQTAAGRLVMLPDLQVSLGCTRLYCKT